MKFLLSLLVMVTVVCAPFFSAFGQHDPIVITGTVAGLSDPASEVKSVYFFHNRCGATVMDIDTNKNVTNPMGVIEKNGQFSITVDPSFFDRLARTGVRADMKGSANPSSDAFSVGILTKEGLKLFSDKQRNIIMFELPRTSVNLGDVDFRSMQPPALEIVRAPDGGLRAGGGSFTYTAPGEC